jgi:hypothetical protein
MTLNEAHSIQTQLAEQEFPTVLSTAVFFALFKARDSFIYPIGTSPSWTYLNI